MTNDTYPKLLDMRQSYFIGKLKKIDGNHLAVHESCYVAKMALENGQSQPSTVAKEGPSQPSTPQKPTT